MTKKTWFVRATFIIAYALPLAALTALTTVKPALAGFDWTPPPQHQAAPPVKAAPAQPVESETLGQVPDIKSYPMQDQAAVDVKEQIVAPAQEPADNAGMKMMAAPSSMPAPQKVPVIKMPTARQIMLGASANPPAVTAPMAAAAPPPPATPKPKKVYKTVDGFGSDIPLALAMHQIVPASYSYSFDDGVDPGLRVSWNGGKPWNEVLEDAVMPFGLRVMITDDTVWLRKTWDQDKDQEMQQADDMAPIMHDSGSQSLAAAPAPMPSAPVPTVNADAPPAMQVSPAPMAPPPVAAPPADETEMHQPKPLPLYERLAALDTKSHEVAPEQSYPHHVPAKRENSVVAPVKAAMQVDSQPASMPAPTPAPGAPTTMPMAPNGFAPTPIAPAPMAAPPTVASAPQALPSAPRNPQKPVAAIPGATDTSAHGGTPVMDPFEIRFWQADQGASLRDVLERWSSTAGVALLWNSKYDYVLPTEIHMHGTFPDAITEILMHYNNFDPRPYGQLHPNLPSGPSVLVVENYSANTN